jgi:hypothetical protein
MGGHGALVCSLLAVADHLFWATLVAIHSVVLQAA